MSDEQDILGRWHMKFKQWTWEYKFLENRTVTWVDIYNGKTGRGQWTITDKLINIRWHGSTTRESWYRPINPDNQQGWVDGYSGIGTFTAKQIEKYVPGARSFDYGVTGVPMFLQGAGPVCWSAGVAMMLGWRFPGQVKSIEQAMALMGQPYIALRQKKKPLSQKNFDEEAPGFMGVVSVRDHYASSARLKFEPLRSYSPVQLHDLMARHRSPLLVEAFWDHQWNHDYVVKRVYGDGSPFGTTIELNDPNGTDDIMNYKDFMEKVEGVANRIDIQVWHY